MELALELNNAHPMPLSLSEKRAHVFRLMLQGILTEDKAGLGEILKSYPGICSRSTLGRLRQIATAAREGSGANLLPASEVKDRLRDFATELLGNVFTPEYDTKGYPTPKTLERATFALSNGQVALEQRHIEAVERAMERPEAARERHTAATKTLHSLGNHSPEDQEKILAMALAQVRKSLDTPMGLEESRSASPFVSIPEGFDEEEGLDEDF